MGIILYILFLMFCIFEGFIGVIVLWNTSGNSNNTQDYSKTDNNSSKDNDDLDYFILFR